MNLLHEKASEAAFKDKSEDVQQRSDRLETPHTGCSPKRSKTITTTARLRRFAMKGYISTPHTPDYVLHVGFPTTTCPPGTLQMEADEVGRGMTQTEADEVGRGMTQTEDDVVGQWVTRTEDDEVGQWVTRTEDDEVGQGITRTEDDVVGQGMTQTSADEEGQWITQTEADEVGRWLIRRCYYGDGRGC